MTIHLRSPDPCNLAEISFSTSKTYALYAQPVCSEAGETIFVRERAPSESVQPECKFRRILGNQYGTPRSSLLELTPHVIVHAAGRLPELGVCTIVAPIFH